MTVQDDPRTIAPEPPPETFDEAYSRVTKELAQSKTKNSIVATSGLDSWNEVKDDSTFKTLSTKQKIECAKQFDPVTTGLNEMFQSKRDVIDKAGKVTGQRKINSKEFYESNIENYPKWNKYQQQKFNVLLGQIETRESNQLVQDAKDTKLLNARDLAGIKSLNFKHKATNIADEWGYVLGDIAGDEKKQLTEGIVNVLKNIINNPHIKLKDETYNPEKARVIAEIDKFVETLVPGRISGDTMGWEMEMPNPITGEPTMRTIGGENADVAKRKLAREIIRAYNKITEHIGSSNREAKNIYTEEKKKVAPDDSWLKQFEVD